MAAYTASVRKIGSPDYGHHVVECQNPICQDINGRAWQQLYSRRTVEGRALAARAMQEHNAARHPEGATK